MTNSKVFTQEEIKEIRSRIKVSVENTGRFIRETRLQHHLSQSSLGSVLFVTKKAVSKWERGLCYPSMDVLPYLAEALGVTTDEILYAKFDTDNKYEDNNKTLKLIYRIFKSKHIKNMIRIIAIFVITILTWFYIENYNAVKIYSIVDYDDSGIHLENALLVTTKQKEYLNIGNIYLDFSDIEENTGINYTFYIGSRFKIEKVVKQFTIKNNILLLTNIKDLELSDTRMIDNIDKLYLNIKYINKNNSIKNYTVKLNAILKYRSNDVLHIFKAINDSIFNKNTLPELNTQTSQFIAATNIDLSFLYNMTDEERKEKFDNKYINVDNEIYDIKTDKLKMLFRHNNIECKIDFSSNILSFENIINKTSIIFVIENKRIEYTQQYKEEFTKFKKIIFSLKN